VRFNAAISLRITDELIFQMVALSSLKVTLGDAVFNKLLMERRSILLTDARRIISSRESISSSVIPAISLQGLNVNSM